MKFFNMFKLAEFSMKHLQKNVSLKYTWMENKE